MIDALIIILMKQEINQRMFDVLIIILVGSLKGTGWSDAIHVPMLLKLQLSKRPVLQTSATIEEAT